jgi:hypothetical protein
VSPVRYKLGIYIPEYGIPHSRLILGHVTWQITLRLRCGASI